MCSLIFKTVQNANLEGLLSTVVYRLHSSTSITSYMEVELVMLIVHRDRNNHDYQAVADDMEGIFGMNKIPDAVDAGTLVRLHGLFHTRKL